MHAGREDELDVFVLHARRVQFVEHRGKDHVVLCRALPAIEQEGDAAGRLREIRQAGGSHRMGQGGAHRSVHVGQGRHISRQQDRHHIPVGNFDIQIFTAARHRYFHFAPSPPGFIIPTSVSTACAAKTGSLMCASTTATSTFPRSIFAVTASMNALSPSGSYIRPPGTAYMEKPLRGIISVVGPMARFSFAAMTPATATISSVVVRTRVTAGLKK